MKKILVSFYLIFSIIGAVAQDNIIYLQGRVKESLAKTDLTKAYVLLYDSEGNVADSVRANNGYRWRGQGVIDTLSNFTLKVPKVDSTYVYEVICDGYQPRTMTYTLENPGKRERYREIPTVYLDRAPRQLQEVTVTSSKIKFYNKGDTVVYNADAFQLAEGSMLDALIAQLPGAELNNDGQIKINGQFVESLLLNGKEFLDGNNNLMLENIAAYTVKDVQVYEGEKKKEQLLGNVGKKILTMDVRLKKEYNIGWLINALGGYGTNDRYIGKLFASWFNPQWRVSLVGNANNLNDNRKPGRADTWTPEMMPSGKKEYRQIALNYNYEDPEGKKEADGSLAFEQVINRNYRSTYRTNFLPGGDTYENTYSNSNNRSIKLRTNHYISVKSNKNDYGVSINGSYTRDKNSNSDLSGTFDKDPGEMSAEILDAIYSNGSDEQLSTIINRSKTMSDGWTKAMNGSVSPFIRIGLPHSNDYLFINGNIQYSKTKAELWNDYDITFGRDVAQSEKLRQYFDNSPNHDFYANGMLMYSTRIDDKYFLALGYRYSFMEQVKDSYMYELDHLNDMGIYGILPPNYTESFDPQNSYTSRLLENNHMILPNFQYYSDVNDGKGALLINFIPRIEFSHRHFNYWRNNKDYHISKGNTILNINGIWTGMVEYQFNFKGEGRDRRYRNSVRLSYSLDPTLPDMFDMVDVVNDSNPLNIYYGNPDLKTQNRHRWLFRWSYTPFSHTFENYFYLSYTTTKNALTRGYTYDTSTGARYNRMYNVDGNNSKALTNELSLQFGSKKQFTLSSTTDIILAHSTDMIGIDMELPELTKVKNNTFTENIKLAWKLGQQNLSLRCDFTNRHTASTQVGFNTLNANHVNVGVSGIFNLPAGFGISTDFTCYTRRGYGVSNLDTTDPIWNLRLSYAPPRNKHWVFMIDGFDMLHQLSNVSYAVTASGRTVSYTNALPRYVLFSIQYRLNIQPKKR